MKSRAERGWAVVTGASSGIGQTYARALATQGFQVLAVARRRDRLEALAREVAAGGGHLEPLIADLTTASGIKAVAGRAAQLERVTFLVNNAGLAEYGEFLEMEPERSTGQIQLNVVALVELTRAIAPLMLRAGGGSIVNVSSGMGFQPVPFFAVYAACKAFVLSFTDSLARELRGTPIQVQALCPGVTRTEFGSVPVVEEVLRRFPSGTAEEVVATSLRGLRRGRVVTVVGAFTWVMSLLARLTPRRLNRVLVGRLMQPPPAARALRAE